MLNFLRVSLFAAVIALIAGGWMHHGYVASGGGSPTWSGEYATTNSGCGGSATCTISGLTVVTGYVVAGFNLYAPFGTASSVTMCGTSLSHVVDDSYAAGPFSIWGGTVTGGSSCSFVVVQANGMSELDVAYGTLNNLTSTTAGSTCTFSPGPTLGGTFACSSSLTVSSGGFGIAVAGVQNAASSPSIGCSTPASCDQTAGNTNFAIAISHITTSGTPGFTTASSGGNVAHAVGAAWR